jgi:hypothetical protein
MKICEENQSLAKIWQNIGHFTWRLKYVLIFVMTYIRHKNIVQTYKEDSFLHFHCWQSHVAQQ